MGESISTAENDLVSTVPKVLDAVDSLASVGPSSSQDDSIVSQAAETKEDQVLAKLTGLVRKGRTEDVLRHLEKHCIRPDAMLPQRGMVGNHRNATLLHLASSEGRAELGADPTTIAGGAGAEGPDPARSRTAYEVAKDKEVRNAFRRFMASHPDQWDWISGARVPSALTPAMEEEHERKAKERRTKDKERKAKARREKDEKAKASASAPVESEASASSAPLAASAQQRAFPTLSRSEQQAVRLSPEVRARLDRERRAQAAEARMRAAASCGSTTSISAPAVVGPDACAECSRSLAGTTPFERLQYRYCSTECVRRHRVKLEAKK
ncbi:MAG: hypothetical protein BJ554DRAFT_2237 [Olpidium bornovanus]|uniref:Vms1-associating treble clef domain-containing protein n=1 Tax=Olpidium bornovanus TaxID=278681 RepID=A0A8H8DGT2_9FUNG|nr:MAG: hypothetical protein BJ554DRAFT_2237 [Olpidium bornovanus]